jgi:endonuclease/exonuclease/phosphatase family metal-dependent hydrolase
VDRDQPRSHGRDLTAEVATVVGAVAWRFEPTVSGTPGLAWSPARGPVDGPAYGIGLVSRWPVRSWRVVRLPVSPLRSPVLVPGPSRPRVVLLRDEPRVLLSAVVETPTGPLTVATTHLSFVPGWNVRQLRRAVAALGSPGLLAGDLNLPLRALSPALARTGWRPLARVPTYPAAAPRVQLDHVLASGAFHVVAVESRALPVSDHRALVVELRTVAG